MEIKFINHASLIFSYEKINLMTDPWLDGAVFHEGWSLLSETKFKYDDFKLITHIWFSHEHPDHFFPPNIKAIPEKYRKKITILYQATIDKKVVNFCKKLKFKNIIELSPGKEIELSRNFKITNGNAGHDSWLYIKTDEHSFLNTNDCVLNTNELIEEVIRKIGPVDILLSQFSYASKVGNINEPEKREEAVDEKLTHINLQLDFFKPRYFIPIASFVWFSHEENFYMNDSINTVDKIESFILQKAVTPIILYPQDNYSIGEQHDNSSRISKYKMDLKNVRIENTKKTIPVKISTIQSSANDFRKRLRKKDLLGFLLISFFPIKIYLIDLDQPIKFSALFGFKMLDLQKKDTNILMTSEVLDYCFKFDWGFGATNVNGRFQYVNDKDLVLFNYYFSVTDSLNHEDSTFKRVLHKITRKIKSVNNRVTD